MAPHTLGPALTELFAAHARGDAGAGATLFAVLYEELRRMARREVARRDENGGPGATTLLHEAYLVMAARDGATFPDRGRFLGYAARVMRGLIIDSSRNRRAMKRGGAVEFTSIDSEVVGVVPNQPEIADLSAALDELAAVQPALAQIVDLNFFCGFSFVEIAAMNGSSERTIQRQWEKARLYLYRRLRADGAL